MNKKNKSTRKPGETRGRPSSGRTEFVTVNILREVRELTRRYLLKRELQSGQITPMSTYVSEAVMERLNRDRAEL